MYCSDIEDLLSPYLDHELPPEENPFVEKHLQHCSNCRQTFADLKKTSNLLQSLPNVPIPDGFQAELHLLLASVNQDQHLDTKRRFPQSWLQRLFVSYRIVSATLILLICFTAYSFSTFHKNISPVDHAPAMISGNMAMEDNSTADLENKEKARQLENDKGGGVLTQENAGTINSNKSKGKFIILLSLIITVSILTGIYINKFRRKH